MGGFRRGLDPLGRNACYRLAGRHLRARAPRDVAERARRASNGRAGTVLGDAEGVVLRATLRRHHPRKLVIQYAAALMLKANALEYWVALSSRAMTVCKLLLRQLSRKLAVADADGKAFHEFRHRVFAVGADQLGEGREQAGLRQAVAIDAIVPRLRPGLVQIAQRGLFLLVIGQRVAGGCKGRWIAHETQQAVRDPERSASNASGLACSTRP